MALGSAVFPPSRYGPGGLRPFGGVLVPFAVGNGQFPASHGRLCVEIRVGLSAEGNKVLRRVVRRVSINVVDVLVAAQSAAVRLLPDNPMLRRVARVVGKVVSGHPDKAVAEAILLPSALPTVRPLAPCVVAAKEADRMALVLAELRARLFCDRRFAAAPTFALAAWNRALRRLQRQSFSALSELRRSLVVAGEKSRRTPVAVMRSRNDSTAATTLAGVSHANNLVGSLLQVNS